MKELICQLCDKTIFANELFNHLTKVHNWQVKPKGKKTVNKAPANKGLPLKPTKVSKSDKNKAERAKLLKCPHCLQVQKNKSILERHASNCPQHPKFTKNKKAASCSNSNNIFDYNWACQQKLDAKYDEVINKFVQSKDLNYLSTQISLLTKSLSKASDKFNREKAISRLILISKAKQRLTNKIKKDKSKKKATYASRSTDLLDQRGLVVSGGGGPGSGKRR